MPIANYNKSYFWAIFTLVAFRNGRPTQPVATNKPPAERNVAFVVRFFTTFSVRFLVTLMYFSATFTFVPIIPAKVHHLLDVT